MTLNYTATFKDGRVGRCCDVAPLEIEAHDADGMAEVIYSHVKNFLVTRDFLVTVDLSEQRGWIQGGRFGEFTLDATPGWCPDECPRCGYRLKRDGFPVTHQSSVDGTICGFSWEPLS
jgi:hypothetical protein